MKTSAEIEKLRNEHIWLTEALGAKTKQKPQKRAPTFHYEAQLPQCDFVIPAFRF